MTGADQVNKAVTFPRSVGRLTIDPVTRKLHGPAGETFVEPLVMRLLILLVDSSGEVVSRRDLFEALWGNAQVGDDSLNRLVVRLREALRESTAGELLIETVPRVGYRLLQNAGTRATLAVDRRTLIGIGAAAGVTLIGAAVWGRTGRGSAEAERWIDQGDTLLRDVAPLQAGVAVAPLRNALAIDPANARALGLLALAEETQANNGGSPNPGPTLRAAEQAAKAALERNAKEPHARLALLDMSGATLNWIEWEKQLLSLHADAPANLHVIGSLSSFLQAAGQTSRAWTYNEQAAAVAPSSPTPQWRRALRLWTGGREEEALWLSERLLRLWPQHPLVWNARFMILAFTGRVAAAAAVMNGPKPARNSHAVRPEQWRPTLAALGEPTRANVEVARRTNLAAAQMNPGQAAYAAMALSQLGELDAAFAVMDAVLLAKGPLVTRQLAAPGSFSANSPSWCRTQWLFMPPLAAVRADPRFGALCNEVGLTQYWHAHGSGPDTSLPRNLPLS
jgi:DNA-binding winged helix-turn-helix (wHTH) protein